MEIINEDIIKMKLIENRKFKKTFYNYKSLFGYTNFMETFEYNNYIKLFVLGELEIRKIAVPNNGIKADYALLIALLFSALNGSFTVTYEPHRNKFQLNIEFYDLNICKNFEDLNKKDIRKLFLFLYHENLKVGIIIKQCESELVSVYERRFFVYDNFKEEINKLKDYF